MIESGEAPEEQKRIERHKLNAFVSYCETATCRRQILLHYFGDSCEPCGNCDTCTSPPKTFDGTVAAQKALSCIYRTGQMFGANYVIDVLLGKDDERIRKFGHDNVSTFGVGGEHTHKEWQGIIRQLLSHNLLRADLEAHGALRITPEGAAFLKEKRGIELRVDEKREQKKAARSAANAPAALASPEDEALFARLRALRLEIAKEQNLPPYVIFHDKTLMDMVLLKPGTLDQMSLVNGVGRSKLDKYGKEFLAAIREG
jgi:ATP-dependent DNA helicase RecQ